MDPKKLIAIQGIVLLLFLGQVHPVRGEDACAVILNAHGKVSQRQLAHVLTLDISKATSGDRTNALKSLRMPYCQLKSQYGYFYVWRIDGEGKKFLLLTFASTGHYLGAKVINTPKKPGNQ